MMDTTDPNFTPPTAASAPDRPPQILVVDDQPDSLRLLQMRLELAGIDCVGFGDGQAALDYLATHLVDVVILDVMMPKLDGLTVCRRLKTDPRTRDIPVLFLTGNAETADKIQGLEAGGHDYLAKPVDQQELLARTQAALRVKRLQDQLKGQFHLQQQLDRLHQDMLHAHWAKTFGQLAASLAHEINNPLAGALGGVQLLTSDASLDDAVLQRLVAIEHSVLRAAEKLRSLLLVAQTDDRPHAVRLADFAEDLLTLVNYQAIHQEVALVKQVDAPGCWNGPPGKLARAALYLLNNAIEAVAHRTGATVTLTVTQRESHHLLVVADNGLGIPEPIRGRIFEPFFTTKAPPHHGVGLSLAAEIVKSLGGRIDFQSPAATAATEFRICLPADSGTRSSSATPASANEGVA